MQQEIYYHSSVGIGGRVGSQQYRENFGQRVEETVNRYEVLHLVKRVGKELGFTARMIQLLDYYINYTRDLDWEEGGQPVIYQSLAKTALDMGVNERQIQYLEKALFDAGALTWNDSGNHKRYGQRCPETGAILYAYGVDLTPLANLKGELESKLHDKLLYDQAWLDTKRQISYYRSQIRACIAEGAAREDDRVGDWQRAYDDIAVQIRTYIKLPALRELLDQHKEMYDALAGELAHNDVKQKTDISSCSDANNCAHYKYPKNKKSNKLDTRKAKPQSLSEESSNENGEDDDNPMTSSGLQHITLTQALSATSERFQSYLPLEEKGIGWDTFIDAAYRLKGELGISQTAWASACQVLGRSGAALCVLLTDQATQREFNRAEKPAAYFNGMIDRARVGGLKLHNSIFGILKNENRN